MNVGFDPGSQELRVLWRRGQKLVARQCRSAYSVLPDEPAQRQLLAQSRLPFALCDGHLVLLGDAISTLGVSLRSPTWPLLPEGRIAESDPLARDILFAELETLLPPSATPEALCGISFPRDSVQEHNAGLATTHGLLSQWVRRRGYTPLALTPGRALVLAELLSTGFTGLAVTFGAACCSYSLCHQGAELVTGHVARGGQWLDEQLATQLHRTCLDTQGRQWPDTEGIAAWKMASGASLLTPRNHEESLLSDLYRDLLNVVYQQVFDALFDARLPRPFPSTTLLVSGGLTRIAGFRELLVELWLRPGLPLEIDEIRHADDSPFTIARGCLIHAGLASTAENAAA